MLNEVPCSFVITHQELSVYNFYIFSSIAATVIHSLPQAGTARGSRRLQTLRYSSFAKKGNWLITESVHACARNHGAKQLMFNGDLAFAEAATRIRRARSDRNLCVQGVFDSKAPVIFAQELDADAEIFPPR